MKFNFGVRDIMYLIVLVIGTGWVMKPRIEAFILGKRFVACEHKLESCQADLSEFDGTSDRVKSVENDLSDRFKVAKQVAPAKNATELNQWIVSQYSW